MIEKIADVQHQIWSHWMKYLFSVCTPNEDGSVTIPADKVSRWQRQLATDYADLTEKEQSSDIRQAEKVMRVIDGISQETIDEIKRRAKAEYNGEVAVAVAFVKLLTVNGCASWGITSMGDNGYADVDAVWTAVKENIDNLRNGGGDRGVQAKLEFIEDTR